VLRLMQADAEKEFGQFTLLAPAEIADFRKSAFSHAIQSAQ